MWWKILKSFSKIFWKTLANHLQAILTLICIEGIATTKTKTNPQGISMHVDFVWQYYKLKKIVSSSSLLLSGCNTSCFSHGSILCFSCLTSSKISWGLGWGKMSFSVCCQVRPGLCSVILVKHRQLLIIYGLILRVICWESGQDLRSTYFRKRCTAFLQGNFLYTDFIHSATR